MIGWLMTGGCWRRACPGPCLWSSCLLCHCHQIGSPSLPHRSPASPWMNPFLCFCHLYPSYLSSHPYHGWTLMTFYLSFFLCFSIVCSCHVLICDESHFVSEIDASGMESGCVFVSSFGPESVSDCACEPEMTCGVRDSYAETCEEMEICCFV